MKRRRCFLFITLFLLTISLTLLSGCDQTQSHKKTINIIFRYDDFSAKSNTQVEAGLIDIFQKHNDPITFAVIPFIVANNPEDVSPQALISLPLDKADLLRMGISESVVELAIHGYSHQTIHQRPYGEFDTLDYHSQLNRLKKSKMFIEMVTGVPVTIFVPPWNRYDRNTIIAMKALGLKTISASAEGEVFDSRDVDLLPKNCNPLTNCVLSIPATCSLYHLKDCILAAEQSDFKNPAIVVLLHSYDFLEDNADKGFTTIRDLSEVLSWLHQQTNIKIISMSECTPENQYLLDQPLLLQLTH